MNSFAPNDVHHLINAISLEYILFIMQQRLRSNMLNGTKT